MEIVKESDPTKEKYERLQRDDKAFKRAYKNAKN